MHLNLNWRPWFYDLFGPGVKEASVSLPGRSALVEYDENIISLEKMKEYISGDVFEIILLHGRGLS